MPNPNENCLEGMVCPKCGSYGPFRIEISTIVIHGDDGVIDDPNDKHWDGHSFCGCCDCPYTGSVEDFSGDK